MSGGLWLWHFEVLTDLWARKSLISLWRGTVEVLPVGLYNDLNSFLKVGTRFLKCRPLRIGTRQFFNKPHIAFSLPALAETRQSIVLSWQQSPPSEHTRLTRRYPSSCTAPADTIAADFLLTSRTVRHSMKWLPIIVRHRSCQSQDTTATCSEGLLPLQSSR